MTWKNLQWTKKRIAVTIVEMVLLVLIVVNIRIIYIQYKSGAETIEDMPYAILEVTGGSMEPVLSQGDGVFVYQVPFTELEVEDIIVYEDDGELVTHQIIAINGDEITAQGVANDTADDPVTEEFYKGKVIFTIPYLSGILFFYESPEYFAAFAAIIFVLVFGSNIFAAIFDMVMAKSRRGRKRDKKNQTDVDE